MSTHRKRGHRRTAAECAIEPRPNLWKRKEVNAAGNPLASSKDAPPCAEVIRSKMVIRFFDWTTYVRALRMLEKEVRLEFYAETDFQENNDEQQPV
jgi:hypothetical protein